MRVVKCYECAKLYNYDEDAFCPRCGAFNQPPRSVQINGHGDVVHRDGINERGHAGSFLHEEYHAENRLRRKNGLDQSVPWEKRRKKPAQWAVQKKSASATRKQSKEVKKGNGSSIGAFILFIFIVNLLRACSRF